MKRLALTVGFALAALAVSPAQAAKPAAVDWSKRTATTTDGGFVMGSPTAKLTLVEFTDYQ